MPKRRRRNDDEDDEISESEYEDSRDDNDEDDEPASDLEDEEQEDDEDNDDADDGDEPEQDEDKAGRPRKVASAPKYSKKKAASPRSSSSASKNRALSSLSTDDRKTAAGGYSHTVESKLRISQANRGNTPWNKGRNRSELDKAKITAGVRARNHLLAKKQREAYGLTEAEADQYKRRIKYLREKVRRLRADNDKRQDAKREGREAWVKVEHMAIGGRSRSVSVRRTTRRPRKAAAESESSASVSSSGSSEDESSGSDGEGNEKEKEALRVSTTTSSEPPKPRNTDVTGPELAWTPHPMDNMEMRHMCSRGGPGGFGCCADCTAQCTQYMVATFAELEKQKISNVGIQVQQLQEISAACSRRLEQTVRATRRKPTPLLLASYRRPQAPTAVPHASPATVVVAPLPDASGGTEVYEV